MEEISRYDDRGPDVLEQCELRRALRHPFRRSIHWISGRDLANVRPIPCRPDAWRRPASSIAVGKPRRMRFSPDRYVSQSVGEAAWAHTTALVGLDANRLVEAQRPGRLPIFDDTGQHTPGPDPECVRFLVNERDVLGSAPKPSARTPGRRRTSRRPSVPLLHARRGQVRAAMLVQSRPIAADRCAYRRCALENPSG